MIDSSKERRLILERLESKLWSVAVPLNGGIELTYRCNLKCKHCYIPRKIPSRELSTGEIIRVIDDIYESGVFSIYFTGGEPFLREDFFDIYTHARKRGLFVTVFTNATLITHEIASRLADLPPQGIEVTVNGISQRVYEEVTGVEGSFRKVMDALEVMKKMKLPVLIKANGMTINRHEVHAIKRFSEELLGEGRFKYDAVICSGLDGSKAPLRYRLSVNDIIDIQYSDADMLSKFKKLFLRPEDDSRHRAGRLFQCSLNTFQITPYGHLRICPYISKGSQDVLKRGFRESFRMVYEYLDSFTRPADSK